MAMHDTMDATTITEVKQGIIDTYIRDMDLWYTFSVENKDDFGDHFHTLGEALEFLYKDLFPNDETNLYDKWLDQL